MTKANRIDSTLSGGVHAGILAAQAAAAMTGEDGVMPFAFDGFQVRIVVVGGEPHFVGKDVAERLGYADATNAMKQHCKGVVKRHPLQTAGGVQHVRVLTEPDVLRLIIGSKLPAAERFERWVFEEVLPAIRRTGSYRPEPTPVSDAKVMAAIQEVRGLVLQQQRQLTQLAEQADPRLILEADAPFTWDPHHPDARLFKVLTELQVARANLSPVMQRYLRLVDRRGKWEEMGLRELAAAQVSAYDRAKSIRAKTAVGWFAKLMMEARANGLGNGAHGLLISALQDAQRIGL